MWDGEVWSGKWEMGATMEIRNSKFEFEFATSNSEFQNANSQIRKFAKKIKMNANANSQILKFQIPKFPNFKYLFTNSQFPIPTYLNTYSTIHLFIGHCVFRVFCFRVFVFSGFMLLFFVVVTSSQPTLPSSQTFVCDALRVTTPHLPHCDCHTVGDTTTT